jgi:hypothetical protein
MARHVKSYKLPNETNVVGLRVMETKDISAVTLKLNEFLKQFQMNI